MDINEALRVADELVLAKTGKHLDNLQQEILRGSWQGKKYSQIAKEFKCSDRHVGNVASKLWQMISEILEENVTKSSFRSAIERYQISQSSNFLSFNFVQKGSINFCTEPLHHATARQNSPPPPPSTEEIPQDKPRLNLKDAPAIAKFYHRTCELTTLENWIIQKQCRLVAILGISGTGKSAIARHLIPQIQTQFDCIFWHSLRTSPPLETTIKKLIEFIGDRPVTDLPDNIEAQLAILLEYLRNSRCLIVCDHGQQLFQLEKLSGTYKTGYENYGTFFKLLGELEHNSCVIFTSWEPALEMLTFPPDYQSVQVLYLTGISEAAAREILQQNGLLDEDKWGELINLCQANPLYLKLTARTINNLFAGKVAAYLSYQSDFSILGDELTLILQQKYQRLSPTEKQVLNALTVQENPANFPQLLKTYQGSPTDIFPAIQSLVRRGLIAQKIHNQETVFPVMPVFQEYVKNLQH
jgi:hypothetical protein